MDHSLLKHRYQCVTVNNKRSRQSSATSGVIQGSVFGFLLFTLYINGLPSTCEGCVIKLFADNVKAYKCIRSADDRVALQTSLDKICTWAARWRLGLLVEKFFHLQIGHSNFVLVYKLNGQSISPCEYLSDLGITVNSSFKSVQHCTTIASKASARSNLIFKTFLSSDSFILTRVFISYVHPILKYCSPVWSSHYKQDFEVIENVQRKFTRKLFHHCCPAPTSYSNRLTFLGLQQLELRCLHADLIYGFKLTRNIASSTLSHTLHFANNTNTRGHRNKLFIYRCKKLVFENVFYKSHSACLEFFA